MNWLFEQVFQLSLHHTYYQVKYQESSIGFENLACLRPLKRGISRLLTSSNSKHKCKRHFCQTCLQGFHSEESRDKHFKYCKDNNALRIEMPNEGSLVKFQEGQFHDRQNQFKVPFVMMQTLNQF